MKNAISFILVLLISVSSFAQMKVDRYQTIGVGISTGVPFHFLGHETYQKYSIQYRKCVGFGILKINANYVCNAHDDWNTGMNLGYSRKISDTSRYEYVYSELTYRTDVRIGLDRDVGQGNARILAGIDFIAGQMMRHTKRKDTYFLAVKEPGASEFIRTELSGALLDYSIRYLKFGFDVTVGIEFQISDRLNLTTQWAPEWNMYRRLNDSIEDELTMTMFPPTSYADMVFAFDVYLSYKF